MPRSLSWFDASEWESVVRRVRRRPGPSGATPSRPQPPLPRVRSSVQAIPPTPAGETKGEHDPDTIPPPAHTDPTGDFHSMAAPPFELVEGGTLDAHVSSLVEWLDLVHECVSLFVTDEHGLTLAERRTDADLVAMSALLIETLAEARVIMGSEASWLVMSLGDESKLHLVAVDTPLGRFGVGMLTRELLSSEKLRLVQQSLERTMGIRESHG